MKARWTRREMLQGMAMAGAGLAAAGAGPAAGGAAGLLVIRTLGTGASDHDWARLGEPGVRGSAGTLVDGRILIDCGYTGLANLTRAGVAPGAVTDLLITHSHGDHFQADEIGKVIEARGPGQPPLTVWAAPQALEALEKKIPGRYAGRPLAPGVAFEVGRCRVTALPANHALADLAERALHFLFETPCGTLLYALDGAWMLKEARQLIGKRRLDMIIWDATMAKSGDVRIFEHNDLAMIGLMMQSLQATGCAGAKTVCVLDHIARTLWPADLREAERLAAERGWVLAADGLALELRGG
jgi:phosphoribosyl 1,2-cyclic phosphate phosphodiesterase